MQTEQEADHAGQGHFISWLDPNGPEPVAVALIVVAIFFGAGVVHKVLQRKAEKRFGKLGKKLVDDAQGALMVTPVVGLIGWISVTQIEWPYGCLGLGVLLVLWLFYIRQFWRSCKKAKDSAGLSGEPISGGS